MQYITKVIPDKRQTIRKGSKMNQCKRCKKIFWYDYKSAYCDDCIKVRR